MAISIDWGSKIINVPATDMTLVDAGPPEIRELNINGFRQTLNSLQANSTGIVFDTTHEHTPPSTLGGVTFARVVEIINSYQVKFQDLQYTVNVVGGNSNMSDVKVQNQVSVNTANSGGLVQVPGILSSSDVASLADGVWDEARVDHISSGTFGEGTNVVSIAASTTAATKLSTIKDTLIIGTIDDTNFTPTTTQFEAGDITASVANVYKSAVVVFTSGNLKGLRTDISGYSLVSGKGHFTVTAMPQAPANGDAFVIV